ncbi:MAG: GNAT family N-acetyltransferase [Bacteroidales bacterium]
MIIKSGNLEMVLSKDSDVTLRDLACKPEVAKFLTEKWTYPEGMPHALEFTIYHEDTLIGFAELKSIRWFNRRAEVGLFLDPQWQGRGMGFEAMQALVTHAFDHLNLHRLEAEVIEYNKPALRLVENLGFVNEGLLREARYYNGKYFNILSYGLLRREFAALKNRKK